MGEQPTKNLSLITSIYNQKRDRYPTYFNTFVTPIQLEKFHSTNDFDNQPHLLKDFSLINETLKIHPAQSPKAPGPSIS
jgi:hypothetical protein